MSVTDGSGAPGDGRNEAAHRALMQLYLAQGDRTQALRQYQICRERLQHQLGVKPEAETERLYTVARAGQAILSSVHTLDSGSLRTKPQPSAITRALMYVQRSAMSALCR
jgi:DNA-binding SARP family transcriptional activator